jgi:hypothetical protein
MRKILVTALLGSALSLTALTVSAQHNYVKDRPQTHEGSRPARPDAHHVWVGSEWRFDNGHYAEVPGHWDAPPRGHKNWVAGHWVKERRGNYWVPGHWS